MNNINTKHITFKQLNWLLPMLMNEQVTVGVSIKNEASYIIKKGQMTAAEQSKKKLEENKNLQITKQK